MFSSPRVSKDPMLVPRTGRIWETVCPGGLSPFWFRVKTLDSAVAGHLKEHLRTLQAPFITSKQKKIRLVFRILTILHSSNPQQRSNLTIYTPPSDFILTTSSKGSSLLGFPFFLAKLQTHNPAKPISTKKPNPETSAVFHVSQWGPKS